MYASSSSSSMYSTVFACVCSVLVFSLIHYCYSFYRDNTSSKILPQITTAAAAKNDAGYVICMSYESFVYVLHVAYAMVL